MTVISYIQDYLETQDPRIDVVQEYGADPTGATDSSTAITNAFNAAANGSTVYFPAGTYDVSTLGAYTYANSFNIKGDNAVLDAGASPTEQLVLQDGLSNITIEGITFESWERAITTVSTTASVDQLTVKDCKFTNCTQGGVWLNGTLEHIKIIDNHFENIGGSTDAAGINAILIESSDANDNYVGRGGHIVTGNTIIDIDNTDATAQECHAILIRGWGCVVSNNYIRNVESSASAACEGIYVSCHGATVTGNNLIDAGSNAYLMIKGGTGTTEGEMGHVQIGNNVFQYDGGIASQESMIEINRDSVSVANNTFRDFAGSVQCIDVYDGNSEVVIIDNDFWECVIANNRGLVYFRDGDNEVSRNRFWMPVTASTDQTQCIYHQSGSTNPNNVRICDNVFRLDAGHASTGTGYVIRLLSSGENYSNIEISGNEVSGIGDVGSSNFRVIDFTDSGAGTHSEFLITNNRFDGAWRDAETYVNFGDQPTGVYFGGNKFGVTGAIAFTSNDTLTDDETCGLICTNEGASGTVTLTLPPAIEGAEVSAIRVASQSFRLDPDPSDTIADGGAGKYLDLTTDGAIVKLRCYVAGKWFIESLSGIADLEN